MPGAAGPVPRGMPVVLDREVCTFHDGRVLLGGDPGRLLRLRPAGLEAVQALAQGEAAGVAVRALARTLLDGGLAHPRPLPVRLRDVIVLVPVRDRAEELGRCLAALGRRAPVLVVDDGSLNPSAVAEVCRRYGAELLPRPTNGGPAAARNSGLAATSSPFVALLDSDCVPEGDWLERLLGHLDDPAVAAVAPRVRAAPGPGLLQRYAADRGPLDLGAREAQVRPGGRVPYVPTAALVVRRAALATPPFGPDPFDPDLRYGEDVDLVWRLHDAGWRVRYDPRTVVTHQEPGSWRGWLVRRHRYGTSAAPLAQRHGERLTPLVVAPWPTAAWLLLLGGRPRAGLVAAAIPAVRLHRLLRRNGLPAAVCAATAARTTAQGVVAAGQGLGGAGLVVAGPLLLAALVPRRSRRTAAAALLAPPLLQWVSRRPPLDPVRRTALCLVDDLAYASGVWRSCLGARTLAALRPRLTRPN